MRESQAEHFQRSAKVPRPMYNSSSMHGGTLTCDSFLRWGGYREPMCRGAPCLAIFMSAYKSHVWVRILLWS